MKSKNIEKELKKVKTRTDIARVRAMRDSEIDCSEIPETDEGFWKDAEVVLSGEFLKAFNIFVSTYNYPFKTTQFHWTGQTTNLRESRLTAAT